MSVQLTLFEAVRAGVGGLLIGIAAAILLLGNGRVAGVSGIVGRIATAGSGVDRQWRLAFVAGLIVGGAILGLLAPNVFGPPIGSGVRLLVAGALVGVGTQLGNGCTSGHGVCGIGRGSPRSIVATGAFMAAGAIVVALVRAELGGS